MTTLEIKNLAVSVGGAQILNDVSLTIKSGEVHAVMGPNGAGKSTLSAALMGKPGYTVTGGSVALDGVDMLALPTWQRAIAGLHLIMQYPTEIPGVMLQEAMAAALDTRSRNSSELKKLIEVEAKRIGFDPELVTRSVNVDFSGGEKSEVKLCNLQSCNPKLRFLTNLTQVLISTPCAIVRNELKMQLMKQNLVY